MLCRLYIEALLIDAKLADQDWEAWIAEKLIDGAACIAWFLVASLVSPHDRDYLRPSLISKINNLRQKLLLFRG